MAKIVEAEYIEKFSCIGPKCEDDCCHGWTVFIDKDIYLTYNNIKDKEMSDIFREYLEINNNNNSDFDYAVMKMKSNGKCPMQEETKLCKIHKVLGAGCLSDTCYIYPKIVNRVGEKVEISGTISCPEIARKVLLNKEKMKFNFIDESKVNKKILRIAVKNINENEIKSGWKRYVREIRSVAIEIIQNRDSKLIERMLYLGIFIKKLEEIIEAGKENEIEFCIKHYREELRKTKEFKISKEIPQNIKIHLELLKSICNSRIENGEDFRYVYDKLFKIFEFEKEVNEELIKKYEKNYFKYARRFFNENEYIMENFIVNELFQNVFPYGEKIFRSYVELVIKYGLFRYITIAFAIEKEELNNEVVIDSAYRYSRVFEHSQNFLNNIYEKLRDSGFDNLSYMTLIMKI